MSDETFIQFSWVDPVQCGDSDRDYYASIGYAVTRIASLEYYIDYFIFLMQSYNRSVTASLARQVASTKSAKPIFPNSFSAKGDFFVLAFACLPELRKLEDSDGSLDLLRMQFMFDEISDLRNAIVHGDLREIVRHGDSTLVSTVRFVRAKKYDENAPKNSFEFRQARFSVRHLELCLERAAYLKSFLHGALDVLDGRDVAEEEREAAKNRAKLRDLINDEPYVEQSTLDTLKSFTYV